MKTEFRKAEQPKELRSLVAFDRKVFGAADRFYPSDWQDYECWWLLVNGRKLGCCAFEAQQDTLYIASTGIHPKFQRVGLGSLMKAWQVAYAKQHGYRRIVTNTRQRNVAIQALNRKFGFHVVCVTPNYYRDPLDATVVMELVLPNEASKVSGAQ